MAYIRHRARNIQQSVFQDLKDTMIACHWMAGTTSNPVTDPDTGVTAVLTRAESDIYPITEGNPVQMLNYFPESGTVTAPNTVAVDIAQPGDAEYLELGSALMEQPYLISIAMFASSDAVAVAVLSDMLDRYQGRIVRPDYIDLYDWANSSTDSVGNLDVNVFRYSRDLQQASPHEVHLYYGELDISDYPPPGSE